MAFDIHELPPWALPAAGGVAILAAFLALRGKGNAQGGTPSVVPVGGQGGGDTTQQPDVTALVGGLSDTLAHILSDQANAAASDQAATRDLVTQVGKDNAAAQMGLLDTIGKLFGGLSDREAAQAAQNQALIDKLGQDQTSLFQKMLDLLSKPIGAVTNPATGPGTAPPVPPTGGGDTTNPPGGGGGNTMPGTPDWLTQHAGSWAQKAKDLYKQAFTLGQQRLEAGTDTGWGFKLPVAYNGQHDTVYGQADQGGTYGESGFASVARWVADIMARNPNQDPTAVARSQVARLGADILDRAGAPLNISQDQAGQYLWIGGFDFGPVWADIQALRRQRHGG